MQVAPRAWVISAGIGAAVLVGAGGWLWARSRRRGVRVRVSVELEGLTERCPPPLPLHHLSGRPLLPSFCRFPMTERNPKRAGWA